MMPPVHTTEGGKAYSLSCLLSRHSAAPLGPAPDDGSGGLTASSHSCRTVPLRRICLAWCALCATTADTPPCAPYIVVVATILHARPAYQGV